MASDKSESKLKVSAHTLETDDLLSLLEGHEVIPDGPVDYENDVLNFIGTFGLEPGQEKIRYHTLYLIYKVWSKNPLKKLEFLRDVDKYFETVSTGPTKGYLINQNSIKLTHNAYKHFTNRNTRMNSKFWAKHFENFLKFHSLTKGSYYIDVRILNFIYDRFCHLHKLEKGKRLGVTNFNFYCRIFLPEKTTKHGTLYGVSNNIEQFFQVDQLARMKKEYEKEDKAKSKKRKQAPGFKSKAKPKNPV